MTDMSVYQQALSKVGTEQDWKYVDSLSEVQARAMTALWVRGCGYPEIADEWNCTTAAARLAVERVLSDSLDDSEDRSKQRLRLAMQYDAMMREVMPIALKKGKNQQMFIRLALQIAQQKSKLLGLDAPIEITVTMPTDQELTQWADQVLSLKGLAVPEEGDPFEMTENPDTGVYE